MPELLRTTGQALGSPAEARTLLAGVLGVNPSQLWGITGISDQAEAELARLVERRRAGEPLQYLTGLAYFRTLAVPVGPGVFIPRPETELLAGWAIDQLAGRQGMTIVELCAGSGAISLALAAEAPGQRLYAVEADPAAYRWLSRNTTGTPITTVQADMAQALPELAGQVDLVVANPPYIPTGRRGQLPADVDQEPDLALYAGTDGLDAIKVVAKVAARLLKAGGQVACEHDDSQGDSAPAIFRRAGFGAVQDHLDLAGRPRYLTATNG